MSNSRLVYSTDKSQTCAKCGWPVGNCQCSKHKSGDQPVPPRVVAKIRLEKAGRGGKSVTVVYDLPRNAAFLKELCTALKRACGAGGAVRDDTVEIQGDLRDRVREVFKEKGFAIKG